MEIISQRTKKIMEECKERARDNGLSFDDESLEYIVTNRDMLELSPKMMIPTLYDYWVNDVEVLKGFGKYKLYPHNPYETVINTRPAISFYNDNNPDWLNIMIFYHVLGHIDFFQNNLLFEHTWDDDFAGLALADKRMLANLRSEHGRWVDYIIEFARGIDNLVGYFDLLSKRNYPSEMDPPSRIDYYFGEFLQNIKKLPDHEVYNEAARYNELLLQNENVADSAFISDIKIKYPEFSTLYHKYLKKKKEPAIDVMQYILENSPYLDKDDNNWMTTVINIVRNNSIYFSPQIRTKICNEGWASYWHDFLFRSDERISGHESEYAKTNAAVTSISRVGLNPYAIGLRLIEYIEELGEKGKINYNFQRIKDIEQRENYNKETGKGKDTIFKARKHFSDFMLINTFVEQDFVDKHNLFVVGQRPNPQRQTIEYYVKSRKAEDYKKMLLDSLYHPPLVSVVQEKTNDGNIYLKHHFEGKQLYKNFVPDTLIGIEFLWGGQAQLETTEIVIKRPAAPDGKPIKEYRKVLYTAKGQKVTKKNL